MSANCSLPFCHYKHSLGMQREIRNISNMFQANTRCSRPLLHASASKTASNQQSITFCFSSRNGCLSLDLVHRSSKCRRIQPCRHSSVAVQCVQALERSSPQTSPAESSAPESSQGAASVIAEMILPRYYQSIGKVELVVAGAGPSGLAVAERVSQAGAHHAEPNLSLLAC